MAAGGKACLAVVFCALFVSVALSGCYWLRYADLTRTHTELIEDLSSATLASLEASSRPLEPGEIERLRYPLARAKEFAEISRKRYAERASLLALDALIARYAEFIAAVERARIEPPNLAQVAAIVSDIHARAADVRAALEREDAG